MCSICHQFLSDFVETGLPPADPMSKLLHLKNLTKQTSELVRWFLSLYQRIPQRDFEEAYTTASRIAKRGRGEMEYQILIYTSTTNLLIHKFPWIQTEMEYPKILLVEEGVFQDRERNWRWSLQMANGYFRCMIPRVLLLLQELHRDHSIAKIERDGLIAVWKSDDEASCADTDDYQKEILNDPTYGDWYD